MCLDHPVFSTIRLVVYITALCAAYILLHYIILCAVLCYTVLYCSVLHCVLHLCAVPYHTALVALCAVFGVYLHCVSV